jgi:hypothetical protein
MPPKTTLKAATRAQRITCMRRTGRRAAAATFASIRSDVLKLLRGRRKP